VLNELVESYSTLNWQLLSPIFREVILFSASDLDSSARFRRASILLVLPVLSWSSPESVIGLGGRSMLVGRFRLAFALLCVDKIIY
jgi:hypothetical protein